MNSHPRRNLPRLEVCDGRLVRSRRTAGRESCSAGLTPDTGVITMSRPSTRLTMRMVLMALITIVPALGIIVYDQASERRRARDQAVENAVTLARLAANQQATVFGGVQQLLATLVMFPGLTDADPAACQMLLRHVLHDHPAYINLWVVDANGDPFCAATIPPLQPGDPRPPATRSAWFTRVMRARAPAIGDYQISRLNRRPDVVLAQPIVAPTGRVERVVAAAVGLDQLNETFSRVPLPRGASLTLTDRQGTILARTPDAASWIGRRHAQFPTTRQAGLDRGREMHESIGSDGVRRLYTVVPVDGGLDTGLFVTLDIESTAVLAEANQLLVQHMWLLALVTLGAIAAALIGGRVLVLRPMDVLRGVTQRIADGDFSARAQLASGVPGLSDLADAVNSMAVALQTGRQERDEAGRALRDAEARMRFALKVSRIGVWEHDPKAEAVFWSETLEEMHGLTPGTFGGRVEDFIATVHPDDRETVVATLAEGMSERHDAEIEYRTLWPDGTERRLTTTGHYTFNEAGEFIHGAGVTTDVTEQRSLEDQLRQSQKMDAIGRLAGGVAHDFNNMLTAILGSAEFLLDDLAPCDARRGDVEEIMKAGHRAATLTQQLLAFSRKQILSPKVLCLGDVVAGMTPMLRRLLGETIDLRATMSEHGHVKADAGQIEQVLMNLAVNARDAMANGGHLTIETADVRLDAHYARQHQAVRPGPYVMVAVSDTGHGMDAALQKRIFEPFFTTKPTGQGTGLGLATVYGIVKQSGGHIDVYSEAGRGTTFKIYLPRTEEVADALHGANPAAATPRGHETILVVEDEELVREFVSKVLTRQGYRVHAVESPGLAIAYAAAHRDTIDLVLTDVVLPDMSGPAMISELRQQRFESDVLYMSGYTDEAIVHHGVLEPGMSFIQKPFTSDALAKRVREALDSPDGRRRSRAVVSTSEDAGGLAEGARS